MRNGSKTRLSKPLVHGPSGRRIYLASSCCWAPFGWEVARAVIEEAKPTVVVLEQPPADADAGAGGTGSGTGGGGGGAPPPWVQAFLDHFDAAVCEDNLSPSLRSRPLPPPAAAALGGALAAAGARGSRVGRDVLDPDEHFGFYAHNELFRFPERILEAWELLGSWGYLPGARRARARARAFVAAAQLAARGGAALVAADAPLALQERWVEAMLAAFAARRRRDAAAAAGAAAADQGGAPLPYELLRDSHALQARLPPGFAEWDAALAAAHGGAGAGAALAFKLSRACAAAALGPRELPPVAARLRRLQPLKWEHFARRELHMAWRLRELCEEGLARGVRHDAGGGNSSSAGAGASGGGGDGEGGSVVVLLGRQHVGPLRTLWEDGGSPLWRDALPREFGPSVVEELNRRAAAAAEVADAAAGGGGGGAAGGGEGGSGGGGGGQGPALPGAA
ncbi:MAG: hypothetical protein J3K34DRAFT_520645 [Monoraphidium minutum]|nr:MAG: hypothetical protein J3K34DRAFT_520645 [Monoraphidium minutum]